MGMLARSARALRFVARGFCFPVLGFRRYFGFLFCEEEPWAAERLVTGALSHPSEHILEKEA